MYLTPMKGCRTRVESSAIRPRHTRARPAQVLRERATERMMVTDGWVLGAHRKRKARNPKSAEPQKTIHSRQPLSLMSQSSNRQRESGCFHLSFQPITFEVEGSTSGSAARNRSEERTQRVCHSFVCETFISSSRAFVLLQESARARQRHHHHLNKGKSRLGNTTPPFPSPNDKHEFRRRRRRRSVRRRSRHHKLEKTPPPEKHHNRQRWDPSEPQETRRRRRVVVVVVVVVGSLQR